MNHLHNEDHITHLNHLNKEERAELKAIKNLSITQRLMKVSQIKIKYEKLKRVLRHKLYLKK